MLDSFSIDMDLETLTLVFSETVNASTLKIDALTIQSVSNSTLLKHTLQVGRIGRASCRERGYRVVAG